MATDTAFAVALIVMMGRRVPIELRIFLTAAAIVDDIGAITVIAVFYAGDLHFGFLAAAAVITGALALLNRSHVYTVSPYALLGVALWACVHAGGLHASLAGVILALFIPTRPPPDLKTLMVQASTIVAAEAWHRGDALRRGLSLPALHALDQIHERLESPAARLLRHAGARSSYVVLPLFALANAGVVLTADVVSGHQPLMLAIVVGLVIGKPVGMLLACALAVWLGVAVKPDAYSWRQVSGAGALAGIGFTMSLFIAGQAFPVTSDFAAAKIAVFAASVLSLSRRSHEALNRRTCRARLRWDGREAASGERTVSGPCRKNDGAQPLRAVEIKKATSSTTADLHLADGARASLTRRGTKSDGPNRKTRGSSSRHRWDFVPRATGSNDCTTRTPAARQSTTTTRVRADVAPHRDRGYARPEAVRHRRSAASSGPDAPALSVSAIGPRGTGVRGRPTVLRTRSLSRCLPLERPRDRTAI